MANIAIFASGSGSNAQNIVEYFSGNLQINISLILTNNPKAFVIERAKILNIDYCIFNREQFYNTDYIIDMLNEYKIDYIILAGFLWLVPLKIINVYVNKIINIHPALLPKYGGKGMYGDKVHQIVFENKEFETGITIHYVNDYYDEGQIIFQAKCQIESTDNPNTIAEKVHQLEYEFYPKIIEQIVLSKK